jgi:hypothetical protein
VQPRANLVVVGRVEISWELPAEFPIAVNHRQLNGRAPYVTATDVTYRTAQPELSLRIDRGYLFDGASIPRVFWIVPGFQPLGKHLWAALIHDWCCDHPDQVPRVMADALFTAIVHATPGISGWRKIVLGLFVRVYGSVKTLFRSQP